MTPAKWYTVYIMSNIVNENNLDAITIEVCLLADNDIWDVIKEIADYGIDKIPAKLDADTLIDTLIKLKYDNLPDCPY